MKKVRTWARSDFVALPGATRDTIFPVGGVKMLKPRFLRACRGEPVDRTPIWFMRQAGRYMADYRALRRKHSLIEICRQPELAAEVTLQPVTRFGLDAAIIFADILLPLPAMGMEFEFAAGEGPVIARPLCSPSDLDRLQVGEPESALSFVLDAIRLVKRELHEDTALIGFAGAPFTLASYMIEGGHSRHFIDTKLFMRQHPRSWQRLMELISEMTQRYLMAQVAAGAQAVQLFDSWAGCLSPDDYRSFVLPYSKRLFEALSQSGVPAIHFTTGTGAYLPLIREAGGDVISIDWRISLKEAWARLGDEAVLQGNLDPVLLLGPPEVLRRAVKRILRQARGRPGYIFNLGHGILPQTPEENIHDVVSWVRAGCSEGNMEK